jgi:hypothetical protein
MRIYRLAGFVLLCLGAAAAAPTSAPTWAPSAAPASAPTTFDLKEYRDLAIVIPANGEANVMRPSEKVEPIISIRLRSAATAPTTAQASSRPVPAGARSSVGITITPVANEGLRKMNLKTLREALVSSSGIYLAGAVETKPQLIDLKGDAVEGAYYHITYKDDDDPSKYTIGGLFRLKDGGDAFSFWIMGGEKSPELFDQAIETIRTIRPADRDAKEPAKR